MQAKDVPERPILEFLSSLPLHQGADWYSPRDSRWTVVGVFESDGDLNESTLLADAATLLSAYQRTAVNSVTVRLESTAAFDAFKAALTTNPTLSVSVERECDFYARQSAEAGDVFRIVGVAVAIFMGLGAIFAALNTMYSAVSARAVEIATLRALGFGSAGVVVSVFAEALTLSIVGALSGAVLAWLLFNGNAVSTISGGGGLSQVAFHLRIGFDLVAIGIAWACAVGLIGGLFPAIRAARLPVATALRAA